MCNQVTTGVAVNQDIAGFVEARFPYHHPLTITKQWFHAIPANGDRYRLVSQCANQFGFSLGMPGHEGFEFTLIWGWPTVVVACEMIWCVGSVTAQAALSIGSHSHLASYPPYNN